ncbi:MAG: tetratricopeptide repeat protein [Bacteroidetes bacterium]|nr:tetratricopeptide repeat protein [Bacteroidota bacterium]
MKTLHLFLTVMVIISFSLTASAQVDERPLPDFDKLWDYGNPKQTEIKFRELIPLVVESGNISYYAQLLTPVARAEGLQDKFKEAHNTLDTVELMLTDKLVVPTIRYLLERGRVFNSNNEKDIAKSLILDVWKIARAEGQDLYAVDAAHMLGIAEDPENQIEWNLKAIELAEKSSDEKANNWLGALYNNTGWLYHDLGQYEKALDLFERGLRWRQQRDNEAATRIAKWTVGRVYRSLGRIDEAIKIQKELQLELIDKGLEPDGYVYEELAECYLINNDKNFAQKYFKLAYEYLSKDDWLKANEPERLERLKELGEN